MKNACPRVMTALVGTPWAIQPEKLEEIVAFVNARLVAREPIAFDQEQERDLKAVHRSRVQIAGKTAVLTMHGTISQRANMLTEFSGGVSTEQFSRDFREALSNENVKTVLIEIDSPGGSVFGVGELADEIFEARQTSGKKIVVHANSLAASAAYWLGSQAHEFIMSPGGMVGSIGVFALHLDHSRMVDEAGISPTFISAGKFKTEGNELEPLTDDAQASMQSQVDFYYGQFINAVARGRGVKVSDVRSGFGQGRVEVSKVAKATGMVDRIAPFGATLQRFGVSAETAQAGIEYPLPTAGLVMTGIEDVDDDEKASEKAPPVADDQDEGSEKISHPKHTQNIDMRGASVEAVERLEKFVGQMNGSVEQRVVARNVSNEVAALGEGMTMPAEDWPDHSAERKLSLRRRRLALRKRA